MNKLARQQSLQAKHDDDDDVALERDFYLVLSLALSLSHTLSCPPPSLFLHSNLKTFLPISSVELIDYAVEC